MPELPDVEIFKNYFLSNSINKKIKSIDVFDKKVLKDISPDDLDKNLSGKKFKSAFRYGKYLFIESSKNNFLVMHFGMTGFLRYFRSQDDASSHIRVQFNFFNGSHLGFDCLRKFGRIYLTESSDDFIKEKKLGIDPYNQKMKFNDFKKLIENKRGNIKSILLNQSVIAGIGNIYSDEIVYHANVHPASAVKNLDERILRTLHTSMNEVLYTAVKNNAEPEDLPESYLLHKRKKGARCTKCNGTIKFKVIAGRSSYFCNKHQKKY